jgi:hypothetical protein
MIGQSWISDLMATLEARRSHATVTDNTSSEMEKRT